MVNNQKKVEIVFSALADSTRRGIFERLSRRGESRVTSLARHFPISLPAFSRHLRVLERAHLIERRREGRIHMIRANSTGLKPAQQWISHYAAGWEFSLDTLDNLLESDKQKEKRT